MTPSDNDYYYPMRYNKDCGSLEWNYCPISMEIVRTNNVFPIYKTRLELAIKACVDEHTTCLSRDALAVITTRDAARL